jgi:hypothetical protein
MSNPDQNQMKQECQNQRECMEMLLEECMPCYKNYHLEVAIRQLLKNKCTGQAPPELIDSIKAKVISNLAP